MAQKYVFPNSSHLSHDSSKKFLPDFPGFSNSILQMQPIFNDEIENNVLYQMCGSIKKAFSNFMPAVHNTLQAVV